ncbi:MAG: FAD-dependent oxidoreductase [Chloroflexi bacterium]|nr:FAD-dependent oxidoreductase [Chloroflexota bacterium]
MDQTMRTYICTGCGIGECVNADRIAELAQSEFQLTANVSHFLCGPEGVEFLKRDLAENGAQRAVIAACSERVNWDVFSRDNLGVELVERVNIREQVAWSKPPNDEETQALAEDYFRMGVNKAQNTTIPPRREEPQAQTLLVVGGGITGMTAALQAAAAGSEVVLVEKQDQLGGWMRQLYKLYPRKTPYQALETPDVDAVIRQVQDHPKIRVITSAEITAIAGEPGAFDVALQAQGQGVSLQVGSVILATGWEPFDATKLEDLGFGRSPNVITNVMMEATAKSGKLLRPSDGRPVQSVVFVQKARPAEQGWFSYAATVRDMIALKQALYVREFAPEAQVYIIYEDMVTLGLYESFYRRVQQEPNVFLTKGAVTEVAASDDGSVLLTVEDTLIGGGLQVKADLVVLAAGMVPTTGGSELLRLRYRQGSEIPATTRGFTTSNYICFPYETRRTALYAAGAVREPMDIVACTEDATGAALKAIQSIQLVSIGAATHPRVGDLSYPKIFLQRCTRCQRCMEECPFSVIEPNAEGYPTVNPDRCRRCGVCMGACPVQVISFDNYSVTQLSSMVSSISVPEDGEKLRIVAFACENDSYPAFDMAGINRLPFDVSVRVIPVRCAGSVNAVLMTDALSRGVDGVMVFGCKSGDDYQCHFITGSGLAVRRLTNVRETVTRLMMEPERIRPVQLEIADYNLIPQLVQEFAEELKQMGPNPYKGF